jgi:hypothetical protein
MIGFVAFDFVLRIAFRSVMDMTFVIKVRGMDGDDGPCQAASDRGVKPKRAKGPRRADREQQLALAQVCGRWSGARLSFA